MAAFPERDLDRSWSSYELANLSEKDLTKLAFQRALKNGVFFFSGALVAVYIAGSLGMFGRAVGWIAILIYALLTLEPLVAFVTTMFILLVTPFTAKLGVNPSGWRLVQLLITGANAGLYAALTFWIYASMYKLR